MKKYILGIDGMRCGMCEAHVEDVIRRNFPVKKVKASHLKNNVVVIIDKDITQEDLRKVIDPTGYRITSFEVSEAIKGLFGYK